MEFINWVNELPNDFDWQNAKAYETLNAICTRYGYTSSTYYPFVDDIIQNELPPIYLNTSAQYGTLMQLQSLRNITILNSVF